MIFRQAISQFKKLDKKEQERLSDRVSVFSASENNLITHFSKNGIMFVTGLNENPDMCSSYRR